MKSIIQLTLIIAIAPVAWAQSPPAVEQPIQLGQLSWVVAVGRDTIALRDIARTGRPVDASPVAWRGDGPAFLLQHRRGKNNRVHQFDLSGMRASGFGYRSPLETLTRPEGDSFGRVEARYEYRRYFFSNVLTQGLDFGAGVQGGASQWWATRHFSGDIKASESRAAVVASIVAAARFRRGSRFGIEVGWANGSHIGRSSEHHSADPASRTRWGGGWLTDLVLGADVAVARHTSIAVQYPRTDDALMSSHRHFTSARRSLTVGVTYAK